MTVRKKIAQTKVRAAVLGEILAGKPKAAVAHRHHISISTVNNWLDELPPPQATDEFGRALISRHDRRIVYQETDPRTLTQQDAVEKIGVKLYGYLEGTVDTLTAINTHARNPHWLYKQTAGELAQFHRELNRSAIQLTEAFSRGASEEDGDPGGDETAGVPREPDAGAVAGASGGGLVVEGTLSEGSSAAG